MGIAFDGEVLPDPRSPLRDIVFRPALQAGPVTEAENDIVDVQAEQADIDISGAAFDYVRSIRVYHILYSQSESRDESCNRDGVMLLGSYGPQGAFSWDPSDLAQVPSASALRIPTGCDSYSFRSVLVEWRDQAGTYDFEEVRY